MHRMESINLHHGPGIPYNVPPPMVPVMGIAVTGIPPSYSEQDPAPLPPLKGEAPTEAAAVMILPPEIVPPAAAASAETHTEVTQAELEAPAASPRLTTATPPAAL